MVQGCRSGTRNCFHSMLAVVLLSCVAATGLAQATRPSGKTPVKTGRVEGRLVWEGAPWPRREVLWPPEQRGHDLKLERFLVENTIYEEDLVIDAKTRGVAAGLVILPGLRLPPAPPKRMTIAIRGLRFSSRQIVLPRDWNLGLHNADAWPYEIQLIAGQKVMKTISLPAETDIDLGPLTGSGLSLRSRRFPFMTAAIHPRDLKPTVITDLQGRFTLNGVPAGKLELILHHPLFGEIRKSLTVVAEETVRLKVPLRSLSFSGTTTLEPLGTAASAVFRVDGVPVSASSLRSVVEFYRARHAPFEMGGAWLETQAVRAAVLPVAAMFAGHRSSAAALGAKMRAIQARLASGADFVALAKQFSSEPFEARGALLKNRRRRDLDPWLGAAVFETAMGNLTSAIWTSRGLHLARVEGKGAAGGVEHRHFRHIVLAWNEKPSWGRLDAEARERASRAKVTEIGERWRKRIPEGNQ